MKQKVILVLDCGATNIRTVAVTEKGKLLAKSSLPNRVSADPHFPEYKIWDIDEIWNKFLITICDVVKKIENHQIVGITVTTFGVDVAPVKKDGTLLYPIISWACQRTSPIMNNIDKYIDFRLLYHINGVNRFSFNTINKLIWFKENKPEIFDKCDYFAFISNILLFKLCENWATDLTMAGTSMLTDLKSRNFSDIIFNSIGLEKKIFPDISEAGTIIGYSTKKIEELTGIPSGTPVISAGHDTQFAVFGSGAKINQPVLSSGTWEILMARTSEVNPDEYAMKNEVTTEFDPIPGYFDMGVQWLASGILEWCKNMFYSFEVNTLKPAEVYSLMIKEAENVNPENVKILPDFLNNNGIISGLGINTNRNQIYKAALLALSQKTKQSLEILERTGNFKAESLLLVGGGVKNNLWNKLRAETLGIPIKIIDIEETTVLGAAIFAFYGLGFYKSPDDAQNIIDYKITEIKP